MLLRQIEYFCAVCRTGSFTKAADECFVSQSAVSQQVKALEAELEVQLIERTGRTFRLTPAGENYYRKASAILQQLDDLRFETQGIAGGWATKLRFGYLSSYEGWELQGALAAFAARHPNIETAAATGSHDELYRALLSGEVDIAFNDRRRELSADFENRLLFTGRSYVEVSGASPLAGRGGLSVRDLAGGTCILVASPELEEVERAYYRDMLGYSCEFRFVRSREEGRMLVAGNRGFMPVETRSDDEAAGSIVRRIPLVGADGKHVSRDYYAFWLKSRTSPLVEEFSGLLAAAFS